MKEHTKIFIVNRIHECETMMASLEEENLKNKNSKRYWGIEQEYNCLKRIMRMEEYQLNVGK